MFKIKRLCNLFEVDNSVLVIVNFELILQLVFMLLLLTVNG